MEMEYNIYMGDVEWDASSELTTRQTLFYFAIGYSPQ